MRLLLLLALVVVGAEAYTTPNPDICAVPDNGLCNASGLAQLVGVYRTCRTEAVRTSSTSDEDRCYCDREASLDQLCCNCWNYTDLQQGGTLDFRAVCGRDGGETDAHLRGLALTRRELQSRGVECLSPVCPYFYLGCSGAAELLPGVLTALLLAAAALLGS
eukprot:TRINITY_DN16296_c0_g2_i2.p1 TRINITY_DN16296_c0_g2~~TRINITY_DN16296_c0_g2_i2.p1  ORF type:complete len:162 (+),score=29.60 TRINITY_DN16296_c0_g2_i2:57-542(+)